MAIIEKAKANLPAKPTKAKKATSSKAAAAPVVMDDMEDEIKAPSRPLSTASSEGGAETKTESKAKIGKGKAKAVSSLFGTVKNNRDDSVYNVFVHVRNVCRFIRRSNFFLCVNFHCGYLFFFGIYNMMGMDLQTNSPSFQTPGQHCITFMK